MNPEGTRRLGVQGLLLLLLSSVAPSCFIETDSQSFGRLPPPPILSSHGIEGVVSRGEIVVAWIPSATGHPPWRQEARYSSDALSEWAQNSGYRIKEFECSSVGACLEFLLEGRVDAVGGLEPDLIYVWDDDLLYQSPQEGWLFLADHDALWREVGRYLEERALTSHTRDLLVGDLDSIRSRRVIRVITQNNSSNYFIYRGRQMGFDFELAQGVAEALGVRLEVAIPDNHGEMMKWLMEGRGDFIAGSLTVTPRREESVSFSLPYLYINEVLVQREGSPIVESLADLAKIEIVVRRGSSYEETLRRLDKRTPLKLTWVDSDVSVSALLERVAGGEIEATVVDSHLVAMERTFRSGLTATWNLTPVSEGAVDFKGRPRNESKAIAFAVRKTDKALLTFLDAYVRKVYRGLEYNISRKRYFENQKFISYANNRRAAASGKLSPYDDLLRRYSDPLGLDWRLLAAQAYQESRFNSEARSWVGARGIFQLMPATATSMGCSDPEDPEQNIRAAIRYMDWLIRQFEPSVEFRQRIRFALAAFNGGLGHVKDARRLAKRLGYDPDRWFANVEVAMLKLSEPRYFRKVTYGYCRGAEPVKYVSEIQSRYDAYVGVVDR